MSTSCATSPRCSSRGRRWEPERRSRRRPGRPTASTCETWRRACIRATSGSKSPPSARCCGAPSTPARPDRHSSSFGRRLRRRRRHPKRPPRPGTGSACYGARRPSCRGRPVVTLSLVTSFRGRTGMSSSGARRARTGPSEPQHGSRPTARPGAKRSRMSPAADIRSFSSSASSGASWWGSGPPASTTARGAAWTRPATPCRWRSGRRPTVVRGSVRRRHQPSRARSSATSRAVPQAA